MSQAIRPRRASPNQKLGSAKAHAVTGAKPSSVPAAIAQALARLSKMEAVPDSARLHFAALQLKALLPPDVATFRRMEQRHVFEDAVKQVRWLPATAISAQLKALTDAGKVRLVDQIADVNPRWSLATTDGFGTVVISKAAAAQAPPSLLERAIYGAVLRSTIETQARVSPMTHERWARTVEQLRARWSVDLLLDEGALSLAETAVSRQLGTLSYPGAGEDQKTVEALLKRVRKFSKVELIDPAYNSFSQMKLRLERRAPALAISTHPSVESAASPVNVVLLRRPGNNDSLMGSPDFLANSVLRTAPGGLILSSVSKYHPLLIHLSPKHVGLSKTGVSAASNELFEVFEKRAVVGVETLRTVFELDRGLEFARARLWGEPLPLSMKSHPPTPADGALVKLGLAAVGKEDGRAFLEALLAKTNQAPAPLRDDVLRALKAMSEGEGAERKWLRDRLPKELPPPGADAPARKPWAAKTRVPSRGIVELKPLRLTPTAAAALVDEAPGRGFSQSAIDRFTHEQVEQIPALPLPPVAQIEARLRELAPGLRVVKNPYAWAKSESAWIVAGLPEASNGASIRSLLPEGATREAALEAAWRQAALMETHDDSRPTHLVIDASGDTPRRAVKWDGQAWQPVDEAEMLMRQEAIAMLL